MNVTTESDLDELAFRFFKLFARYEYALKAMGFTRAGSKGQAEPDWDAFANDVGQVALGFGEPESTARAYLFEHPPKRQMLVDKRIEWEEVSNEDRSAQALFGHMRRVRNNLYHGGKFNGNWPEPDRSRELLTHVLALLEAMPAHHQQLANALAGNAA